MATLGDAERAIVLGGNLAHLATLRRDGSPHVTPVWIDLDQDDHLLINTCEGRDKLAHVRRDPRVALSISSRQSDRRAVWISGRVVETTTQGAAEHAHRMAERYRACLEPGKVRVLIRVAPEHVHSVMR
jgi:PPOX class probable F420-dependent enzyme